MPPSVATAGTPLPVTPLSSSGLAVVSSDTTVGGVNGDSRPLRANTLPVPSCSAATPFPLPVAVTLLATESMHTWPAPPSPPETTVMAFCALAPIATLLFASVRLRIPVPLVWAMMPVPAPL